MTVRRMKPSKEAHGDKSAAYGANGLTQRQVADAVGLQSRQ